MKNLKIRLTIALALIMGAQPLALEIIPANRASRRNSGLGA